MRYVALFTAMSSRTLLSYHVDILKVEVNKQIFIRAKRSENSLNTYMLPPAFPAVIINRSVLENLNPEGYMRGM